MTQPEPEDWERLANGWTELAKAWERLNAEWSKVNAGWELLNTATSGELDKIDDEVDKKIVEGLLRG